MTNPSGHNETLSWFSLSSYGLHSAHLSDRSWPIRGATAVAHNAQNTVAPIGIVANVLLARWRFADVHKHCSANKNRGKVLIGALV